MTDKMLRISDMTDELPPDFEGVPRVSMADIEDKEVIITHISEVTWYDRTGCVFTFLVVDDPESEEKYTYMGNTYVCKQLMSKKDVVPIQARFAKKDIGGGKAVWKAY